MSSEDRDREPRPPLRLKRSPLLIAWHFLKQPEGYTAALLLGCGSLMLVFSEWLLAALILIFAFIMCCTTYAQASGGESAESQYIRGFRLIVRDIRSWWQTRQSG